jgi:flavorubredoxin
VTHFQLDLSISPPRQRPLEVAAETFVIRALSPAFGGTWSAMHSMVIRAAEPIVIDTGLVTHRESWFEDLFSLVAPDELRWIFVTHNDSDHSGNLVEALERCPNAQLVTSRSESFRCAASFGVPYERMRMVDNGQAFGVGDRELQAIRPPVYDSPYTRGVFDPTTGVYYASDAFCSPMPEGPVDWVEEIPVGLWAQGMASFHHNSLCPWVSLVDEGKFRAEVDKLATLDIRVIAGAHSPVFRGKSVQRAFEEMSKLPSARPQPFVFEETAG